MGYKELYDDVNAVKSEVSDLKADVASIKAQVSNHIPTTLGEIKDSLTTFTAENKQQHVQIEDRLKPIETKFVKAVGVSDFLSWILKITTAAAAVTWTIIQIIKVLHP